MIGHAVRRGGMAWKTSPGTGPLPASLPLALHARLGHRLDSEQESRGCR